MIILDIPNWIMYISWFVFINFTIILVLILWMVYLNKRDIRDFQDTFVYLGDFTAKPFMG